MLNLLDRYTEYFARPRGVCEYAETSRGIEHVEGCSGCEERWWDRHAMSSIRDGFELNDRDQPTMTLSPVPTTLLDRSWYDFFGVLNVAGVH